jgi:two-component sensor histidine kinase
MRILIADDDPDMRALVARALSQEFAAPQIRHVTHSSDFDQALTEAAPDLMIVDYDLHWIDGFKVFERLKAAYPHCPVVMFTGTGNEELAVRAMKLGFDDYVVKRPKQFSRLAASARLAYERTQERLKLQGNRDLILKELYHRLHNNLQIVISLLRLTAKAMPDEVSREQINDLGRRIQALSTLQEEFYRSPDFRQVDFAAYLGRLAETLIATGGGRIALVANVQSLTLPVDVAVPLGLIANELIMNVVEHAFPGERQGRLELSLDREGDRISLVVRDNGVGFGTALDAAPAGLGKRLIERLAAQMSAEVDFRARDTGTECRITLKL